MIDEGWPEDHKDRARNLEIKRRVARAVGDLLEEARGKETPEQSGAVGLLTSLLEDRARLPCNVAVLSSDHERDARVLTAKLLEERADAVEQASEADADSLVIEQAAASLRSLASVLVTEPRSARYSDRRLDLDSL